MDIDLRSDTVTKPTAAMRAAMAAAEVGDDVYDEDPTVHALQDRVAALLGMEAALFVPSGTMANQIALRAHTRPGDEVLLGKDSHVWLYESGALAALSGVQTQILPGDGRFTADAVRAGYRSDADAHAAPTRVVAVENTHNRAGGAVWDPAELAKVAQVARELGMAAHVDGARLWNAAVALGVSERDLVRGFDSVSVCLSKGLGAPVGSLVAGSREFVKRCHRFRKMYGGGMRQAGILAAGGLYALEHHRARLADDHRNARALAEALIGAPGLRVDLAQVATNLVMIELERPRSADVIAAARARGVRLGATGPARIRAVLHLDVAADAVPRAATAIIAAVADVA
jgi:threonine aldolase